LTFSRYIEGLCVEESSRVKEPRLCPAAAAAAAVTDAGAPLMPLPDEPKGETTNDPEPLRLVVVNEDDGGLADTTPGDEAETMAENDDPELVLTGEKVPGLEPSGSEASAPPAGGEEEWFCIPLTDVPTKRAETH
jgi:hypothetical protein